MAGHPPCADRVAGCVQPPDENVPVVLPITAGGSFARTAGFAVSLSGSGSQTTRAVRCDQSRTPDIASRCGRKFESLPTVIV